MRGACLLIFIKQAGILDSLGSTSAKKYNPLVKVD